MTRKEQAAFAEYVEREYANEDGVHWDDGTPRIQQGDRTAWLEEEWLMWQARAKQAKAQSSALVSSLGSVHTEVTTDVDGLSRDELYSILGTVADIARAALKEGGPR